MYICLCKVACTCVYKFNYIKYVYVLPYVLFRVQVALRPDLQNCVQFVNPAFSCEDSAYRPCSMSTYRCGYVSMRNTEVLVLSVGMCQITSGLARYDLIFRPDCMLRYVAGAAMETIAAN